MRASISPTLSPCNWTQRTRRRVSTSPASSRPALERRPDFWRNSRPLIRKPANTCSSTVSPTRTVILLRLSRPAAGAPLQSPSAENLDPQIACALAAQGDIDVLIALANNKSARLEGKTLLDLLHRARKLAEQAGDRRLADALLQRRPVPPESAALFLCATPYQRVDILLAAQRLQLGRPPSPPVPTRSGSIDQLELAAIARQPQRFVAILAEALDCEPELAQRIVDDTSGEPLAVALAALGAENEVLVRALISNDLLAGASYQRVRALARLNNALNRDAAITVIAALRGEL